MFYTQAGPAHTNIPITTIYTHTNTLKNQCQRYEVTPGTTTERTAQIDVKSTISIQAITFKTTYFFFGFDTIFQFLGAFAKLRKAFSWFASPSVCSHETTRLSLEIFRKFCASQCLIRYVQKIRLWLKSDKNDRNLKRSPLQIYGNKSLNSP